MADGRGHAAECDEKGDVEDQNAAEGVSVTTTSSYSSASGHRRHLSTCVDSLTADEATSVLPMCLMDLLFRSLPFLNSTSHSSWNVSNLLQMLGGLSNFYEEQPDDASELLHLHPTAISVMLPSVVMNDAFPLVIRWRAACVVWAFTHEKCTDGRWLVAECEVMDSLLGIACSWSICDSVERRRAADRDVALQLRCALFGIVSNVVCSCSTARDEIRESGGWTKIQDSMFNWVEEFIKTGSQELGTLCYHLLMVVRNLVLAGESHRIDRQQFRALKFANLYLKWIPRLADNANDPRNAAVGCIEGLLASIVEVSDVNGELQLPRKTIQLLARIDLGLAAPLEKWSKSLLAIVSLLRQKAEKLDELSEMLEKADATYRSRKFEDSTKFYQNCVSLAPTCALAHCGLARSFNRCSKSSQGIVEAVLALNLDPECPIAWIARGDSRYCIGDFGGARDDCTRALELHPENWTAYNNRSFNLGGNAFTALAQYDSAINDYIRAVELSPDFRLAYSNLILVLQKAGRSSEIRYWEERVRHLKM